MELRNTAEERELKWLDTPELLEQLKIGLRNVGVFGPFEPGPDGKNQAAEQWVEFVKTIDHLLSDRDVDSGPELNSLSPGRGWLMRALLDECRRWPQVQPMSGSWMAFVVRTVAGCARSVNIRRTRLKNSATVACCE